MDIPRSQPPKYAIGVMDQGTSSQLLREAAAATVAAKKEKEKEEEEEEKEKEEEEEEEGEERMEGTDVLSSLTQKMERKTAMEFRG